MASISVEIHPNCDRISNLPNNLITHILSFLSTKDAVKTSALSTSWNQQWTLVPVIRFDDKPRSSQSFINFVYRVLLYKVSPLDLFQLIGDRGYDAIGGRSYDAINIKDWISVALSRHVRRLEICVTVCSRSPYCLPDCLFSSNTLVVLKLVGNFVFQIPEKISLESLKIFHFTVLTFEGGESFSRLVSSCPVLEKLKIIGTLSLHVKLLNISSLVLKRLILVDLYSIPLTGSPKAYELVLNTPCLQYLEHSDGEGVPDDYHLNTLHCLDTARLSLYICHDELEDYHLDPLVPVRSLAKLVVAISNVRILYILGNSFEALYSTALLNFELPQFNRLIDLELGRIESDAGWRLLMAFLKSSPQLESLSFHLYYSDKTWYPPTDVPFCMLYNLKYCSDETWYAPTDVPFCMLNNLKVIEVAYFHSLEPFLSMVSYFLEKTNCLEELAIRQTKKNEKFIKKVLKLPRASKSCEIVLT